MKTKHTKVRLSLLVVVTALTFGMGGSHAQAENILFEKQLPEKIIELGDKYKGWNASKFKSESSEWMQLIGELIPIAEITIGEGETFSFETVELLCQFPQKENFYEWAGQIGRLVLTFNYDSFKRKSVRDISRHYDGNGRYEWKLGSEQSVTSFNNSSNNTIRGPVTIKIEMVRYLSAFQLGDSTKNYPLSLVQPEQNWRIFFKRERAAYLKPQTQLQALVLPKNTKNTRLIVESSEDLVNWAIDTPGPKTTTNRERFFRLRAVKE
ncbi:hypothetical protein OAA59_00600 [bacterium]|nr:hypothetical protein [bacterium]